MNQRREPESPTPRGQIGAPVPDQTKPGVTLPVPGILRPNYGLSGSLCCFRLNLTTICPWAPIRSAQ